jgi:hypothetical protein
MQDTPWNYDRLNSADEAELEEHWDEIMAARDALETREFEATLPFRIWESLERLVDRMPHVGSVQELLARLMLGASAAASKSFEGDGKMEALCRLASVDRPRDSAESSVAEWFSPATLRQMDAQSRG